MFFKESKVMNVIFRRVILGFISDVALLHNSLGTNHPHLFPMPVRVAQLILITVRAILIPR